MTTAAGPVMFIAAHPDDPEFLAGGTVGRLAKEGCDITYVIMTNGNKGSADRSVTSGALTAIREEEQRPRGPRARRQARRVSRLRGR